MTSKQWSAALLDEWSHGTDLKDQLSADVLADFEEKSERAFLQCKTEVIEDLVKFVREKHSDPMFNQSLLTHLLLMKGEGK